MAIEPELMAMVRAEAVACAKVISRAEGRAQAKIRTSELVEVLNGIRKEDINTFATMATQLNTLGVMMEVLVDLMCDPSAMKSEGTPDGRRARFQRMCDAKAAAFGNNCSAVLLHAAGDLDLSPKR